MERVKTKSKEQNFKKDLTKLLCKMTIGLTLLGGFWGSYAFINHSKNQKEKYYASIKQINQICPLEEEVRVYQPGASMYIMDEQGNRISKGYHYIYTLKDGTRIGVSGSMSYILDENWNEISLGYRRILSIPEGYILQLGATVYKTDKELENTRSISWKEWEELQRVLDDNS